MAFNPFHAFRKHQKVLFAGLTILCMITFILTGSSLTGRGDFFDYVQTLLGGEGRYPAVATLYGRKVDQRDLVALEEQRLVANQYMTAALQQAGRRIAEDIRRSQDKLGGLQNDLQLILNLFERSPEYIPLFGPQFRPQLRQMQQFLIATGKKEEAGLLGELDAVIAQLSQQGQTELYFGGGTSVEDLLDFLIWRQQADRLGIQLTTDDVKREVRREALNRLRDEDYVALDRMMAAQRRGNFSGQFLIKALDDEFRVRLARSSLTGYEQGDWSRVPAQVTPYEFWDFYRASRTEVSVAVLPIPVADFVAQVKEQPSLEELTDLFEKHKEQEYAPDAPTPGFKQPRRLEVEWVSARADTPHYRKSAQVVAAALQATLPLAFQERLLSEYENMKHLHFQAPSWTTSWTGFQFPVHESSVQQPIAVAATLMQSAAAAMNPGTVLSTLGALRTAVIAREVRDRLRLGSTLILMATGSPLAVAGVVYERTPREEFLPLKVVRAQVQEKLLENLAKDLVLNNLRTVKKELDARRTRPEDARKYVLDAVKRYDLRHGHTTEPRDPFTIGEDKGLEPLKEAYLQTAGRDARAAKQFASLFFTPARTFDAQRFPSSPSMRGTEEDFQWQEASEPFLFWKTSDKPAYVPTFEAVKALVEKAWRFEKARLLARQKAEEVAEKVRKAQGDPVPVLRDATAHPDKIFNLSLVSRLQARREALVSPVKQYEPYKIPEDKIEYPSADFVDKVVSLSQKGDTAISGDRPENTYFVVALLTDPLKPTPREFYLAYRESAPGALQRDTLLDRLEQTRREKYREDFLQQLRADARLEISPEATKRMQERDTPFSE